MNSKYFEIFFSFSLTLCEFRSSKNMSIASGSATSSPDEEEDVAEVNQVDALTVSDKILRTP